jgi:VIT1/CCC1 family predicted Fe2+/Mn2+ transporter
MKVFILIIQIILILAMALFGVQKIFMPLPDLIEQGMLWIEDFPAWQVRTIGILEVLGACGLIFPYIIKSLPKIIVVIASVGLALTMVGAVITHISRGDVILSIIITSTLFLMAVMIAVFRFNQYKSES